MTLSRKKLYTLLSIACAAGYIWLFFNLTDYSNNQSIGACIIKESTGIPCPSCGTTRSVISFIQGDPLEALYWNPFGVIILSILAITPIWIIKDILAKSNSLFVFYSKVETFFNRKIIAIPAIILVLMNWGWNIYKGL